ncbi:hypothetical protein HWB19_gp038 [Cronobacter phage vB_CsaP_009]|nr:hypothetical protein HWB19_gp038 [Cronobacter phage vB_CsaP_009]BBU72684.1 hypothetical protein [Cronobacter phage vB_CsaP_009]
MRNVELLQKLIFEHNESDIAHCLLVESKIDGVLDYVSPEELTSKSIKNGATLEMFHYINNSINKNEDGLKINIPEHLESDVCSDYISLYSKVKSFKDLLLGDSVHIENEYGIVINYSEIQKLIQICFINGKNKTYSIDDESVDILKRDYNKSPDDRYGWLL